MPNQRIPQTVIKSSRDFLVDFENPTKEEPSNRSASEQRFSLMESLQEKILSSNQEKILL